MWWPSQINLRFMTDAKTGRIIDQANGRKRMQFSESEEGCLLPCEKISIFVAVFSVTKGRIIFHKIGKKLGAANEKGLAQI